MAAEWTRFRWLGVAAVAVTSLSGSGCGSQPLAPEDELSMSMTSAQFIYRWSAGDEAPDSAYQERHLAWVTAQLGLTPGAPLEYHKYRDLAHLKRVTGHTQGTGFAEAGTYRFHTIWPMDNHEYVHSLVTTLVGTPPSLFNEGVAVAHHGASLSGSFDGDPLWNGGSVHARVRSIRAANRLPDLDDIIESEAFSKKDSDVTYPVAGSFVRYLIDQAGVAPFLEFVAHCPRDASAATVHARFRDEYGEELDSWWAAWLEWL
jgi:hypothetical protein